MESVDILGAYGDDGEVDDVWLNSQPNWLLLTFKTRCSGPGGFYSVYNGTAYPLRWSFFSGWCHFLPPLRLSYLSSWALPVVVARNDIFGIKWRYYGPKGDILNHWGTLISFSLSYYILPKDKGL